MKNYKIVLLGLIVGILISSSTIFSYAKKDTNGMHVDVGGGNSSYVYGESWVSVNGKNVIMQGKTSKVSKDIKWLNTYSQFYVSGVRVATKSKTANYAVTTYKPTFKRGVQYVTHTRHTAYCPKGKIKKPGFNTYCKEKY